METREPAWQGPRRPAHEAPRRPEEPAPRPLPAHGGDDPAAPVGRPRRFSWSIAELELLRCCRMRLIHVRYAGPGAIFLLCTVTTACAHRVAAPKAQASPSTAMASKHALIPCRFLRRGATPTASAGEGPLRSKSLPVSRSSIASDRSSQPSAPGARRRSARPPVVDDRAARRD
jgi:hypothetical protein